MARQRKVGLRAICQHCAAEKPDPLEACPECGHLPAGGERPLAWLLSAHHLGPGQLDAAARRIRAGRRLAPSAELLAWAEGAMGENLEAPPAPAPAAVEPGGPGLPRWAPWVLAAVSIALTPVPAWAAWWAWRRAAPRAARQALGVAIATSVALALLWAAIFAVAHGGGG